ncbi:hypothetical protein B9Z19DRAFT_612550 [Tuber borchii]|uniref:Uncharacterized protein n=1 Tax=Tuber borchii TaxID=42251 RepID=A0A2T6ZBI1_TUBBO|nr:hypothetical protein B9Z19DRAFT_612550 [Tuber borchii]
MCESKKDCNLLIPRDPKYRYPTAPIFLPPPFLLVPQGLLFSHLPLHAYSHHRVWILTESSPLSLSLIVVFWVNFSPIHSFTFPHRTHLIVVPIATASLGQSLLTYSHSHLVRLSNHHEIICVG